MMHLMQIALVVTVSMATMDPREENCLDALQKISPNSDKHALQTAANWLEDNFGAATAEDLKGVSNFAVDAMSLVGSDRSLSADAKRILRRLFLNEVEEAKSAETQRRLASSSTSSTSSGAASTTTTTTTAASTTTTASITATTTTTGPTTTTTTGPATTTTTVTTTTTTVTTTTTTSGVGREFTAKVTMAVEDTSWVTGDKAHAIMKDAIVASNTEVTSASQVTIMELKVATRRLVESGRRMGAGNVLCQYKVTFPSTYTGPGYTSIDTAAMKDKLQKNGQGVNIVVTSVAVVDTPSCAGPQCPTTGTTTMKVTTTQGSELSGAVAAQQLATSLAGILLLNLLSGF